MIEVLVALAIMLLLGFVRVPIWLAMAIVGVVGYAYMRDWSWGAALANAQTRVYETGRNYTLSVVPLFILMGALISRAGMAKELFQAAYGFVGHLRGGMAMATIMACAVFGSVCGSSIATAATMAKVAYPSMKRFGYSDSLATGAIASGGTLGILIPPSTVMVIYGIMTETSIGKLFAAGILPGLLATVLLCIAVLFVTWRDPKAGPPGARQSWRERMKPLRGFRWFVLVAVALMLVTRLYWADGGILPFDLGWSTGGDKRRYLLEADDAGVIGAIAVFGLAMVYRGVVSVLALFVLVMGGIYGGIFTATEGAGVGAFGALVLTLSRRALRWRDLYDVLVESARTTSMLFMILIGALMFAEFVNITSMPADLKAFVARFELHPIHVIIAICAIYIVLGTAMEELAMILLTVPLFFPIVVHLGFDPVWFGILIVVVVQIGLVSPPVGMNLFVLNTLLPEVPVGTIFRGVLAFVVATIVCLGILIAFPSLSLWLPGQMR
ncbi:MAG: TRAP transporter large permease [Rhodospirillaceae bacterium]|nr:TRAP transporter large permease [Rhodospirillaceae bacterium]